MNRKKMFYHVQTHRDIPLDEAQHFRQTIHQTLNDPRSWGISFNDVPLDFLLKLPKETAFIIRLTPATHLNKMYAQFKEQQLSVANMDQRTIHINYCRWTEGCPNQSQLPLEQYRQYVIQHEVGHMMGKGHPTTLPNQKEAPIMMQQTLGIHQFQPNQWPTEFDKSIL
jgi:hypothetical protein